MEKITTYGLDLAKTNFQLHGNDRFGNSKYSRKLTRWEMLEHFSKHEPTMIGMEASNGAFYFARKLIEMGHQVKLMPAHYVQKYVIGNKTDKNDAAAICEAVRRPDMRFVAIKTVESQVLCQLHRSREILVGNRTAMMNQVRAFLLEFGIPFKQGASRFHAELLEGIRVSKEELPPIAMENVNSLLEIIAKIEDQIEVYDKKFEQISKENGKAKLLMSIPGVGVLGATYLIGKFGENLSQFKSAKHFASCLGLTPREHSSGGKQRLGRISKRGDGYARKLLFAGGLVVCIQSARNKNNADTNHSKRVKNLVERLGFKKAAIATANRNARIIWRMLNSSNDVKFDANHGVKIKKAA